MKKINSWKHTFILSNYTHFHARNQFKNGRKYTWLFVASALLWYIHCKFTPVWSPLNTIHWSNQSRRLHALGGETCCSICVVNISESKREGEWRPRQGRCWRARDAWVDGIDGGSWNYSTLLYFDCLLSDFISVFAIWISYLLFW